MLDHIKRHWHYYILWGIVVASLGLNVYTVYTIITTRRQAALAFGQAAAIVHKFKTSSIDYVVKLDNEVPVQFDVPINFTVVVPISQTIPFKTTIHTSVRVLGLPIPISVPISTTVPVSMTVEVPIDYNVKLDNSVPVNFEVPLSINIVDTPFAKNLDDVETVLLSFAEDMGAVVNR